MSYYFFIRTYPTENANRANTISNRSTAVNGTRYSQVHSERKE